DVVGRHAARRALQLQRVRSPRDALGETDDRLARPVREERDRGEGPVLEALRGSEPVRWGGVAGLRRRDRCPAGPPKDSWTEVGEHSLGATHGSAPWPR